jgi:hypothetical protein
MKPKLKLKRLTDGPNKGHVGIFDGDELTSLADMESARQCFDDLEELGWPDGVDGKKRLHARELRQFLSEKFDLVEGLADELGVMILMKMRESGVTYAEALSQVTKTARGAELWRQHQNARRT